MRQSPRPPGSGLRQQSAIRFRFKMDFFFDVPVLVHTELVVVYMCVQERQRRESKPGWYKILT